jgi:hypothetical protein
MTDGFERQVTPVTLALPGEGRVRLNTLTLLSTLTVSKALQVENRIDDRIFG